MFERNHRCKYLFFVFLAMVGSCLGQVQKSQQPDAKPRRLLMWKATSPTATVYLLGSIHLGDKDLYPIPDVVESAFNSSQVLVVEINAKNMDTASTMKLVQQYGIYSGGDTLSKHLPKSLADAFNDFCSKHGVPQGMLEQFKPWIAALTVEVMALQQVGEDPNQGIDMHFLNEVKPPQRIEELETADFQMTVLSSGTEAEQQEMLADTLKEMDKAKEHIKDLQDAYLSGDPDRIAKFMEEHNTPKSLYKRLLDDRNGPMAERVDGYLKKNDQCFVVVGVAHLVGDRGVIRLLRDKNYKVEMITAGLK